ncbi:MAG: polysaccharide pyruvyl transferase family protein [Verrucomicrobia bacterium]|nr:polysaccharide pyruvyl transferase family protein [Verrucomicrobiota bacterium]MBS0646302.1 polysaccharide pyruvyl transferase family protein [Verrucomicrobiota bacterium]
MTKDFLKKSSYWTHGLVFLILILWPQLGIANTKSSPRHRGVTKQIPKSLLISTGLPLCYWQASSFTNFGDFLSIKLVERIVNAPIATSRNGIPREQKKLLAIGSIIALASDDDVVWGSGINGKSVSSLQRYRFQHLDVRAVRGPLTRDFLMQNFHIDCPEVYGDPALLVPYFFPEFQKPEYPTQDFVIIPHYSELKMFPPSLYANVISPLEPWDQVISKILNSRFVISSSLHGIVVAEAFGIPARLLKITFNEPLFKYADYYLGTQRPSFQYATSVEEALLLGGEPPAKCDLQKLYQAFPFDYWPLSERKTINFPTEL